MTPKDHQHRIAKRTLEMNDVFANIMGGPNRLEAKAILAAIKDAETAEPLTVNHRLERQRRKIMEGQ